MAPRREHTRIIVIFRSWRDSSGMIQAPARIRGIGAADDGSASLRAVPRPSILRRALAIAATACLLANLAAAGVQVYASPHDVEPLQPGAHVPTVAVESIDGEIIDLASLVRESGALLVFFRGGW